MRIHPSVSAVSEEVHRDSRNSLKYTFPLPPQKTHKAKRVDASTGRERTRKVVTIFNRERRKLSVEAWHRRTSSFTHSSLQNPCPSFWHRVSSLFWELVLRSCRKMFSALGSEEGIVFLAQTLALRCPFFPHFFFCGMFPLPIELVFSPFWFFAAGGESFFDNASAIWNALKASQTNWFLLLFKPYLKACGRHTRPSSSVLPEKNQPMQIVPSPLSESQTAQRMPLIGVCTALIYLFLLCSCRNLFCLSQQVNYSKWILAKRAAERWPGSAVEMEI